MLVPREAIGRHLKTIGILRDSRIVKSGVADPITLELYDLSDKARLRTASAETLAVAPMPEYSKPRCRDWSGDSPDRAAAGLNRDPAKYAQCTNIGELS
jgi:hypothetical protein